MMMLKSSLVYRVFDRVVLRASAYDYAYLRPFRGRLLAVSS